jgi:hypothetical protein
VALGFYSIAFWGWVRTTMTVVPSALRAVLNSCSSSSVVSTSTARHPQLALIRRFTASGDLALHLRVAACLMLLYAQPLARIIRLTAGDITRDDGQVCLRFGTPPAPSPSRSPRCSRN